MTLIGATTENPYFEVNSALLSRAQIYEFRPLTDERGRGSAAAGAERRARPPGRAAGARRGARRCSRRAPAAMRGSRSPRSSERSRRPRRPVRARSRSRAVEDALQRKALLYDREGDKHYDYISAWIKATRGSDVDASHLLPRGDAGGRRGPALHRPADGDLRLRGRRQRRSAGAGDRQRGGAGRRSRRSAGVRAQPRPGRRLPGAGTEVERLVPGRSRGPRAHVREHGAAEPPPYLQDAALPRRHASSAAARATATRTTSPRRSPTSRWRRRRCGDERFYEPTERGFEAELRERLERLRRARGRD